MYKQGTAYSCHHSQDYTTHFIGCHSVVSINMDVVTATLFLNWLGKLSNEVAAENRIVINRFRQ